MNIKNDLTSFNKNNLLLKPMISKPVLMGPPLNPSKYYTPSKSNSMVPSSTRSKSSAPSDTQIILAICEGRGSARGIVGLAAINLLHPTLILSQIPDGQTYTSTLTKLNILHPSEILIPTSFVENATQNRLYKIVNEKFRTTNVQLIPRNEFNRNRGLQYISNLCAPCFKPVQLIIQDKFYALSATCALIRYIENMRHVNYTPGSIKVEYQELDDTLMIDIDTANLLNLVVCNTISFRGKNKITPSVFGIIDRCVTNVGKRLLRQNILQPPCHPQHYETRHDCVTELLQNPQLLGRLRDILTPFQHIENSLTYATLVPAAATSVSVKQLTYTLQLKMHLIAIQPLAKELRNTKHPKFQEIYERLIANDKYAIILQTIGGVLNEDAQLGKGQAGEIQRCFAIKSGINGFLDVARKMYTEIVDKMRAYVDQLANEFNLGLRAQHTQKMGFHIVLPLTHATRNMKAEDLPKIFYKIERFGKHFAMTTVEMMCFGKQLKNTSVEIQSISNVLIFKLLTDIRPYIGDMYELCDNIAFLDMLISFALFSSNSGYIRPNFSTYMLIENFKHPIQEYISSQEPVTNSVCAFQQSNIQIITGPNMSGKTIFVRTLCLIQILSQLGCRVPATKAILRPCDRLYGQLSNEMTLECGGMSSFTVEMNKFSYLLRTMTDNSFIVLDELCRTTDCEEGFSMAFAICEELAKRKGLAFIVTHYLGLGVLAQIYPNITNWQFEVQEHLRANNTRKSLKFTFKRLPGITSISAYGIKLARICVDSKSIVDRATQLWEWMSPLGPNFNVINESNTLNYLKRKMEIDLNILKIKNKLTPEIQEMKLKEFKTKTGIDYENNCELIHVSSSEKNPTSGDGEISSTSSNICSKKNSFSIDQTSETFSEFMSESIEFSENSFHDPLNHILKSTIINEQKFEDDTRLITPINDESISFLSHLPTTSVKSESNSKTIKPLVSELYFSDSSGEDDEEGSIISLSLSSSEDDNISVLSIDHETFVKNIHETKGVLTSTPIQRKLTPKHLNDFQLSKRQKTVDPNESDTDDPVLSFISESNSGESLFSNTSFKFDPKMKKTKFKPPFKI